MLKLPERHGALVSVSVSADEDEDEKTEEEIEEEIDSEDEEKLKKRILQYREVITEKDPSVLDRLDKKFRDLRLGLEEQAKLLAKTTHVFLVWA